MNKIAFITGATSGIGEACALKFAQNNYNLIICGRREERLVELKAKLEMEYDIQVFSLAFDIRNYTSVLNAIDALTDDWKNIDVLVNNAGLAAGLSQVQSGSIADWEQMIDTNVKGLLYVSKCIIPLMIERECGHIINIGSVAGKEVYPKGNVYCASKFAVDALTKGMRLDLVESGIKVSQVAPGAVETEFSLVRLKGDKHAADSVYKGFHPLKGEDIADVVYYVASLAPHVNINDVLIMPTAQANATTIVRK